MAERAPISEDTIRLIQGLGYAGAIPFAVGTLALGLIGATPLVKTMLLGYGAVVLSFVGGVHWGELVFGQNAPTSSRPVGALYGVSPSILGWVTLSLPFGGGLLAQLVLFIAAYGMDRRLLAATEAGAWYVPLRFKLTTIVVILLMIAWVLQAIQ